MICLVLGCKRKPLGGGDTEGLIAPGYRGGRGGGARRR